MSNQEIISVCAWCSNKKEKTQEALAQGKQVTHWICETCRETQEKAFQILLCKSKNI